MVTTKAQQARQAQAETYSELGRDLRSKKEYKEAINAYKKALAIFQELGEQNRVKEIQSDIKQAQYHIWNAQLNQLNQFVTALIFVALRFIVALGVIVVVLGGVISLGAFIEQKVFFAVAGLISLVAFIAQKIIFALGVIVVTVGIVMSCVVVWKICDLPRFNFYQKFFVLVLLGIVSVQPHGNYFKLPQTKTKVPSSPSTAPISGYRVMCPPGSEELNVRQLPSLSASVISTIPCDTTGVQIIGKETRASGEVWVKIKYQKIQGWSVKRFLSKR
ncbi:MAG: SH3 domain-containing protein [Microcoleus sp. SU_5_3]|nr:SH3 domain-containing protein [Microcoleus sp. SU_5_3]